MIQLCGGNTILENWKPKELESIDCVYEKDKPFDFFTIKFMVRYRGYTVGHQLMENSRNKKSFFDWGAIKQLLSFPASTRWAENSVPG